MKSRLHLPLPSLWLLVLLWLSALAAQAQTTLVQGSPKDYTLQQGQTYSFALPMQANQLVEITVVHLNADLDFEWLNPTGQSVRSFSALCKISGVQRLLWEADTTGTWQLRLKLNAKNPLPQEEISIELMDLGPATPANRARAQADRECDEALAGWQSNDASVRKASRDPFTRARETFRAQGDRYGEARVSRLMGMTYPPTERAQAKPLLEESVSMMRSLNYAAGEFEALIKLHTVYVELNDKASAKTTLERTIELSRALKVPSSERIALSSLAGILLKLGDFDRALDCLEQAIALARKSNDRPALAIYLMNRGVVLRALGETQKALTAYEQSLEIVQTHPRADLEHSLYINIGNIYRWTKEYDKALTYYQRALALAVQLKRENLEAEVLTMISSNYFLQGRMNEAIAASEKALELASNEKELPTVALAYLLLGRIHHKLGNLPLAKTVLSKALAIQREERELNDESNTLYVLAQVARDEGNLTAALPLIESSLQIVERMRAQVTSPEMRMSYADSERIKTELLIDLLLRLHESDSRAGYAAQGWQVSEWQRARVLRELLLESRADIRQDVEPQLLERETTLNRQINELADRLLKLPNQTSAARTQAQQEHQRLADEYQKLQTEIRKQSPRYAALTRPAALKASELQQLLDPDTLLLEYALGEESSTLWFVTSQSIEAVRLPARKNIESAATTCYERLLLSHQRRASRDAELAALALRRLILPITLPLANKKRLVVIADGSLQRIPFGALPKDTLPMARSVALLSTFEIVYLPSASVLANLREEWSKRPRASKELAIFYDPVFRADDERVRSAQQATTTNAASHPQPKPNEQVRLANERDARELQRLPASRREAEAILRFAQPAQTLRAHDFAANKQTLVQGDLQQYRYLHFATHSLFDHEHPALSGLALSLVNEKGAPQDGFVRLNDLITMRWNAELVTLSACRTALGKELRGEGLIGLARGFMYAGTPRVVASLWDVNDEATAVLMKHFYQGLLKERLPAAAALRKAQLELAHDPRWAAPYYWAGFVLLGEWR